MDVHHLYGSTNDPRTTNDLRTANDLQTVPQMIPEKKEWHGGPGGGGGGKEFLGRDVLLGPWNP